MRRITEIVTGWFRSPLYWDAFTVCIMAAGICGVLAIWLLAAGK